MRAIVVAMTVIMLGGCDSMSAEEKEAASCADTTQAFVMSKVFVKSALRSPSAAEFPYKTDPGVTVEHIGGCRHVVRAFVDAPNAFGAKIRSEYSVTMEKTPNQDNWRASGIEIR